uniref:Uncharacterized protein n=1 Tax=Arundo donax TaxID=35708 RepID=A0A0A8ZBN0_ARUDO
MQKIGWGIGITTVLLLFHLSGRDIFIKKIKKKNSIWNTERKLDGELGSMLAQGIRSEVFYCIYA